MLSAQMALFAGSSGKDNQVRGREHDDAQAAQAFAAGPLIDGSEIVVKSGTMLRRYGVSNLSPVAIAYHGRSHRHRRKKKQNCDHDSQQLLRASENGLADHDFARTLFLSSNTMRHGCEACVDSDQMGSRAGSRKIAGGCVGSEREELGVNAKLSRAAVLALMTATIAAAISVAAAQTAPSANVAERQRGMKAMAEAAKTINAMFKGSLPYDAQVFKAAAESIKMQSGAALSALFDGSATPAGSRAGAAIGIERPVFDKLAGELGTYASALSIAADRNPYALGPESRMRPGDAAMGGPFARKTAGADAAASMPAEHVFHLLLQTCTSCHAKFRIDGANTAGSANPVGTPAPNTNGGRF